jgi:hypothetical protein
LGDFFTQRPVTLLVTSEGSMPEGIWLRSTTSMPENGQLQKLFKFSSKKVLVI